MGDPWRIGLLLGAVANLANAAWMLVDPAGWYLYLPAAVPDTGPFNAHFVRDVGSAFAVMGLALAFGALRPALRVPSLAFASGFYVLHALVHVADTAAGRLPASLPALHFGWGGAHRHGAAPGGHDRASHAAPAAHRHAP